jgi:hypothetical protein
MAQMNDATRGGNTTAADDAGWDEMSPLLDEGMNKLRPQDRDALLLKFFEKKSMRQIGDALGISEEAAGKRVARAVERLRDFFRRRGVAVSAVALPALLLTHASHAAPAGMISTVVTTTAGAAAATTATTSSSSAAAAVAKGALSVMAAEKAKALALAAAAIILGVGATAAVIKTVVAPVGRANRQVAVVSSSASTTTTTPAATNAWPIRLPDGTLVEILGINDELIAPTKWWTLDGTIIPGPTKFDPGIVTVPQMLGSRKILVLARFVGVPPQTVRTIELRPRLSGGTTATSDRRVPGAALTQHVTLVGAQQSTASLIIGLGNGDPQQQVEVRNVSLMPGQQTSVQIVDRRPPPEQATAKR